MVVSAAVVVVAVVAAAAVENRTGGEVVSHNFLEAEAGERGSVVLEIISKLKHGKYKSNHSLP